jgi:hypothetical protein
MNVDGFNATQAAAAHPPLTEMEMEQFALSNLGVIQSLIPARIQGQLFTHHPQLLEVDMQVRMHSSPTAAQGQAICCSLRYTLSVTGLARRKGDGNIQNCSTASAAVIHGNSTASVTDCGLI